MSIRTKLQIFFGKMFGRRGVIFLEYDNYIKSIYYIYIYNLRIHLIKSMRIKVHTVIIKQKYVNR